MMDRTPLGVGAEPALAADPLARTRPASLWRDTLANIFRQRSAIVGTVILTTLILAAILAPLISTHDPDANMLDFEPGIVIRSGPCIHVLGCPENEYQHLMGVDSNFRDVYSRVIWAARTSLLVGISAIGIAIVIGTMIGAIAGYVGGWTDDILMRLMEVILAFPALLLAIAIVAALGGGLVNGLVAIAVVAIPQFARVVRASVLATRENDYVTASRALGESSLGILVRRVMPNSITPIVVQGTLGIGGAVLEIAALAFVGVIASDVAEWGTIIGFERNNMFIAPHVVIFPGLAITLTVLGFNLLGDGLRDALDPRLNR
jgi:ABC-type dipeptide/oligopeptide/nickel transport system permease subunit